MWLPTHMFFYSSETDGEDPTGSHKLASVLDTHPNGRVHQHWAVLGTASQYGPRQPYVAAKAADLSPPPANFDNVCSTVHRGGLELPTLSTTLSTSVVVTNATPSTEVPSACPLFAVPCPLFYSFFII